MSHSQDPIPTPDVQAEEKDTGTPEADAPTPHRKRVSKHKYFWPGVAVVCALLLFIIVNLTPVSRFINSITAILSPILIGGVIAYLCNPILKFYEFTVFHRMKKSSKRRSISLVFTFITALIIVLAVMLMIVPQLTNSLMELWRQRDDYLNNLTAFLNNLINTVASKLQTSGQEDAANQVKDYIHPEELTGYIGKIFEGLMKNFMPDSASDDPTSGILSLITGEAIKAVGSLLNILLGIFIAIYLLSSKEKRIAQINKFRKAVFNDKQNQTIGELAKLTNHCFGGFIYGKIIDSLVIGILTFLILTIFEVSPYNLLIATFVGITNIIPVFGPFLGAIPSFFIVLISNPSKAIFFLILILIIQQIDGNVIGPKILGDNTGVSSLSIIIAITVAGGLWGIWGMIIGVPIFAVIIEAVKRFLERRLEEKGEPTATTEYYPVDALGNAEKEVYYEHSGLLYRYEHSRLKPRVDRLLAKFYRRPYVPDEPEAGDTTDDNTPENKE